MDVAVIDINGNQLVQQNRRYNYFHGDDHSYSITELEDLHCLEGETVFVMGFPGGPKEGVRSYPVVRRGTIARIRDTYSNGWPSFIIEALATPGNSGSPVVLRPTAFHLDGSPGPTETRLIGIVSDYLLFFMDTIDLHGQPTGQLGQEHSGLCSVWTVDVIETLIDDHLTRFPNLVPAVP